MNGAILITQYWDNCVDCPCCDFTEYALYCTATKDEKSIYDKQICTSEEYWSYRKYDMRNDTVSDPKAPRPKWCPLIEVRGEE